MQLNRSALLALACLTAVLLGPTRTEAQFYSSIGGGVAFPVGGTFGDRYDTGFTVRGQAGFSFVAAEVHLQAGWTTFPASEGSGGTSSEDRFDAYHVGAGARVSLGLLWVGLNAAHFFGDGENGRGLLPEVGLRLGPFEAVADFRMDGHEKWLSARVNLRL